MIEFIKQLFCFHKFTIIKSRGVHCYQKGNRENIYFHGILRHCKKCGTERFFITKKGVLVYGLD